MAVKATVLYDFEGDTENGELTVEENTEIFVLNKDIGDGWWECQTSDGNIGLVPESYCEIAGDAGGQDGGGGMDTGYSQDDDNWDEQEYHGDDGDDGDDDDNDSRRDNEETVKSGGTDGTGSNESRPISPGAQGSGSIAGRHGTVKKNINRFGPFVKSGSESFILNPQSLKREPRMNEIIKIVDSEEGMPMWEPCPEPYSVEVLNPTKQTKYKGIKSFIAYEISVSNASSSNVHVTRRYKHFDWFHERLVHKFTFLSVPPLPDKQYYGRYGEEFVEKRREKLQMWTNRVARHPVISRSDVVFHVLRCRDSDGKEWKAGKRKAEKDPISGSAMYLTIEPKVFVDLPKAEGTTAHFNTFLTQMEDSCTKLKAKFVDHCNKMSGPFMAEHHRMGTAVAGLAACFKTEDKEYSNTLTAAIEHTADVYREIGVLHAHQPKKDMLPAMDVLKEYLGLIQEFPKVDDIHRGALGKIKDCERMKEEGRIDFMEASEIKRRAEAVSAVMLAEIHHFQHERVVDFRQMMKNMLAQQIGFYKDITAKLESAYDRFNESTDL